MGTKSKDHPKSFSKKQVPARTPEARQNQMVAYAMDLAEKQLREGTASSQVITHFLKLGTTTAQLELEKLKLENELVKAKTDSIKSAENMEKVYTEAIAAMKRYSGNYSREEESDDEDSDIF